MAAARFASHAQLCRSASPCSQVRSVAVARYDEEREEEGERGLFFFGFVLAGRLLRAE